MSTYTKTKFLAKSLMALSLVAVFFAGGAFLVSRNKIGADTAVVKDYEITMNGATITGITANNISSNEVLSFNYVNNPNSDLTPFSGNCPLGENCYRLLNKKSWIDPSIKFENGKFKPAWAFLTEVKKKAELVNDTDSVNKIKSVAANYVADAFITDLKPNFVNFTATSGTITIPYPEFFTALENAKIDEIDPNMEVVFTNSNKIARMKFAPTYSGAKENSAWLAAAEFVTGSMIKPYKDAGFDASDLEAAINKAIGNYLLSISTENKSKILTLSYPPKFLLSQKSSALFVYKIDTKAFSVPTEGYKTKIFIKPASKKDANIFIQYGPFGYAEYQFSWANITGLNYIDSSGQPASVSGSDYDLNFPQQYIIRVVTYDGTNEKDNILATFETQTEETLGDGGVANNGNSILKISAKPAYVKQGERVTATIEAINSPDAGKKINKIVLYACQGTSESVMASDSSSCTLENGEDAVKAEFKTADIGGNNLIFNGVNAKVTAPWNTSSFSSIGNHALMAKAFTADSGGEVAGSKTAVTVKVTNSSIGSKAASGGSDQFSDLLAGQFTDRASDNPRGSKITDIRTLATKVVNIFLLLIGALSVIAIIVGGIFYITSAGDQQKTERGKKTIIYAIFGIVIATLGFVIEAAALDIVNQLLGKKKVLNLIIEKAFATELKFPSMGGTDATLSSVMTLITGENGIIPLALDLAIIVGVIMIFYSAFLYVSSFGEEAKAETAKKTLLWSIIGTIVVFLARYLVDIVAKFLG